MPTTLRSLRSLACAGALVLGGVGGLALGVTAAPPALAQPCPILLPCFVAPEATTAVGISGTPKVGSTLTVTAPQWDQSGVTTTYQWRRGGIAIAGATGTSYLVATEDVDQSITVVATGTNANGRSGTSTSSAVTGQPADSVPDDTIKAIARPVLGGTAAVGQQVTTTSGTWPDPQPTLTYQWFERTGAQVSQLAGETSSTYTVQPGDAGRTLYAVVYAARNGEIKGSSTSDTRAVPKFASTVVLRLRSGAVSTTDRARAVVTLSSLGGPGARGKVVVKDGTTVVGRVTVGDQGHAALRIKRLRSGRHRLVATYLGTVSQARARSSRITLTVR